MEALEKLRGPDPLERAHETGAFACGEPMLDHWLMRRAPANQATGASRTFVISLENTVVAYYALSANAVELEGAPGRFRRNMPDPIPVVLLGRLAVDHAWQGKGLGRAMIWDAARRVAQAADVIGIRGILVHAMNDSAKAFYQALGFEPALNDPKTLMVTLADLRKGLGI
jgi:GNAT superfamily N-acetyltransferase